MHSSLGPLTFDPILVSKPWGGRKLESLGKELPDDRSYGESWEIADLPSDVVTSSAVTRARVDVGPLAGSTLRDLIALLGDGLLGSVSPTSNGDFPLLVKYLDAKQHLSVQVHPDTDFVGKHPGSYLKTESWYVVDAEPGAVLYLGFRGGVGFEDVRVSVGTAEMVDLLETIPAQRGDFHHLPAGTVHALGAGVMVAEIQTPSDTTFRLYDWTREYGRAPRALHNVEGMEALRLDAGPNSTRPIDGDGQRRLVETAHYSVIEHRSSIGTVEIATESELRVLMIVDGEVVISTPGQSPMRFAAGRTIVIPAMVIHSAVIEVLAPATVLEISLV